MLRRDTFITEIACRAEIAYITVWVDKCVRVWVGVCVRQSVGWCVHHNVCIWVCVTMCVCERAALPPVCASQCGYACVRQSVGMCMCGLVV